MAKLTEWLRAPRARAVLGAVLALMVALLIFHAGVVVGSRHHFAEVRGLRMRAPFMGPVMLPHGFIEHGHGAVGIVASVATSTLTLTMRDGSSEAVRLATSTTVRGGASATTTAALAPGARVLILGEPDAGGVITAAAIQLLPY